MMRTSAKCHHKWQNLMSAARYPKSPKLFHVKATMLQSEGSNGLVTLHIVFRLDHRAPGAPSVRVLRTKRIGETKTRCLSIYGRQFTRVVPEDLVHRHICCCQLNSRPYNALDAGASLSSAFSRFRSARFYLFSHTRIQLTDSHFNDTVEIKVASKTVLQDVAQCDFKQMYVPV
jgi:hypothetical protein